MFKILKYTFSDLIRGWWTYVYFAFYLLLGTILLFLNHDLSKAIITMMNIVVILTPMIGIIFGIMYYYNVQEFTRLLMTQPIRRSSIFLGQYLGISVSLSLCLLAGLGIPFLLYGLLESNDIWNFFVLIFSGVFLTFIFVGLSINIGLINTNRIKGFALVVLLWLFFAIIYDGLFLILLIFFEDYPLDVFALSASLFNPIDLSRIMILMKLDISALLGYTGALFSKFFGTNYGMILVFFILMLWVIIPMTIMTKISSKRDF